MTPQERSELRRLSEAATPGPWAWLTYGEKCYGYAIVTAVLDNDHTDTTDEQQVGGFLSPHPEQQTWNVDEQGRDCVAVETVCSCEQQSGGQDFPLIVAARSAIIPLLDQLETAERERDDWKREWSERFGFLAQRNLRDALASIEEVAGFMDPMHWHPDETLQNELDDANMERVTLGIDNDQLSKKLATAERDLAAARKEIERLKKQIPIFPLSFGNE